MSHLTGLNVEERVSNVLSEPLGASCTRHLGRSETQTSLTMLLSGGTRLTPVQTAMQTCLYGDKIIPSGFSPLCCREYNENCDVKEYVMEKKLAAKKQHTLYTSQFKRVVQNHNKIIGSTNIKSVWIGKEFKLKLNLNLSIYLTWSNYHLFIHQSF